MVILEHTQTRLVLRYRPFLAGLISLSLGVGLSLLWGLVGLSLSWVIYLSWFPLLWVFSILLGLILWTFGGESIMFTFDKSLNSIVIKQQSLIHMKQQEDQLTNIVDVQLQSSGWTPQQCDGFEIILMTRMGESLKVNLGWGNQTKYQQKTVDLIRDFLGMSPLTWDWYRLPPSKIPVMVRLISTEKK